VGSVSVIAFREVPEVPGQGTTAPPKLELVAGHEHIWQLRSVEYDESLEVRCYECAHCDDVLFR
jgi:hypothetical protein